MSGEIRKIRLSKCSVGQEEKDAVCRVLDNEYLGMGKEVQLFEQELKKYLDTDLEVICVNTGTAALHLAALCLDLKSDDEVLVPSITYVASYQAISAVGAKPIACDVEESSVFIDLEDAERRITSKTKAIMPVHYASSAKYIDEVYGFARKYNLRVIEDAAQSLGGDRKGSRVGREGDIVCFSLDGIKNITSGEGGVIVTADPVLAQRVRDARLLGVEKDTEKRYQGARSWVFDVKHQGFRYHMSDLMAAIGREQLKKIDQFSKRRREIAQQYVQGLRGIKSVHLLDIDFRTIVPHIFVVKIDGDREEVANSLSARGVATGAHYFPNHLLSLYRSSYALPKAESLGRSLMSLPLHVDLSDSDVAYVIESVRAVTS
ncbi:aminotransferase [Bdellovibrio bacteriovorus]|uniref:Aminotransferase n=1 Tax=Bdellovibrio bacteriovorus TaxID=959 RepID=A0A150WLF6_BDEBC|nr:DegT/DnrJ/EryC1/StrS family aminotransferase [Bdellovibrio bacteriovorus]KYG64736.1 aminotransferase [Bdellovibrio bacteriovorus]